MAKLYWVSACALCVSASAILSFADSKITQSGQPRARAAVSETLGEPLPVTLNDNARPFSIPLSFEPIPHLRRDGPQFIGRGAKLNVALTGQGIELAVASASKIRPQVASLRFLLTGPTSRRAALHWRGVAALPGKTNYLLGNDRAKWRRNVPHYARAEAAEAGIGLSLYAHEEGIEYDLRVPPFVDISKIRLSIFGVRNVRLDPQGDLRMRVGGAELRMRRPTVYEETGGGASGPPAHAITALESAAVSQSKSWTRVRSTRSRGSTSSRVHSPRSYRAPRAGRRRSGRPRADRPKRIRIGDSDRQSHRRETKRRRSRRRKTRSSEDEPAPRRFETAVARQRHGSNQQPGGRHRVEGAYVLEADGTVGFRVAQHDPRSTLVIDPAISLVYSSFLGGMGNETVAGLGADSTGNIYIAGTTTSPSTFPEAIAAGNFGPGIPSSTDSTGTAREFFVAKLAPGQSGANSLLYLTFIGGSTDQAGGRIAVDAAGDIALTGTTTSVDYPVTDSSARTGGSNDTVITEIDSTGSKLLYSTLFGGNGAESQQGTGGIAVSDSAKIVVASDTSSTNLPVSAGAYDTAYLSSVTDGFLLIVEPGATPPIQYCTYLGLNAQVGIAGVAVDGAGDAYIVGSTSAPITPFPSKGALQSAYQGGQFDAFLMKIAPHGNGASDLIYATLLGGGGSDQAFAVAVDSANPPNAYITGTTDSGNFPTNGAVAPYQPGLPSPATAATSDAFLTVVSQSASTGQTSLSYSTYLGGSQTDIGYSVQATEPYAVYLTGTANSWDFPWHDNFQTFNGYGNAFVAKLDTTTAGAGSLVYSTPLGGTSQPGVSAGSQGNAVVLDASGNVWVAGQTESLDFPSAGNPGNGFQVVCASCQESPVAADAFVAEIRENATAQLPSLYFAAPGIPLNFGKQAIGATTVPPQFAAIKNSGEAVLNISTIGITGPNAGDFSLSNAGSCTAASISPGGMCSFEVSFIPGVAGPEEAFVQAISNAPGSPQLLEVLGSGAGLTANPASLNFGNQISGTVSTPQSVTLTNTGAGPVYISSIIEAGANLAMFEPANTSQQCVATTNGIAPGDSCLLAYTFDPTTAGNFSAEIDLQYNLSGEPSHVEKVLLTGQGIAAAPVASVSPVTLNFGGTTVGTTTGTQVITLTNTGSAALDVTAITLTGTDAADFSIATVGAVPCPASSGSLAINASCTIGVQFAPQTVGAKSAALSFTDNAAGSPQTVALTATAQTPAQIQITPVVLTFSPQTVETKSAAQQVAIANNGGTPLALNGISVTGANPTDFSQTNNCVPILAANANCVINATFDPMSPGTRSASLSIADDGLGSPQTVTLTGTAIQPDLSLSTTAVNFGNQAAGTPSSAVTITVTNSGNGTLVVSSISLAGSNASDFTETNNCSGSSGIAPSGTCAIQATFKPACGPTPAARNATLNLTDNAPGSPQSIALTGTGTGAFCFLVPSGGSTSATVAPGQTGSYALQAEAANGFSGDVNLACAGAPSAATCALTPTTVNVGGSELTALQVRVATSGGTVANIWRQPDSTRRVSKWIVPAGILALAIIVLLFSQGELAERILRGESHFDRKRARCVSRSAAVLSLAFALALALTACGGSGASPGTTSDPVTPAGTYPITVTGTTSTPEPRNQ